MNYTLTKADQDKEKEKGVLGTAWRRLVPLMRGEGRYVWIALGAILINSLSTLIAPIIIAHVVDDYIATKDMSGVFLFSGLLALVFIVGLFSNYVQIRTMGGVGRRTLYNLRNTIFTKLQELPVAFFNQNKAGDLISRINNDTEKLNQFFAQALMQFIGSGVLIIGAGIFLISLNVKLGLASLIPAAIALIFTRILSPWVKRTSLRSLRATGGMSGEVQESLNNFKVIVAFNRLDYFRTKFREANQENYRASIAASIASNVFLPIYTFASALAQLIVLVYGIMLIESGGFTVGLLIGFLLYVNSFYSPLRQLASVWSSLQLALAGLDRISEVLALRSDMKEDGKGSAKEGSALLEFKNVHFSYSTGKEILHGINMKLERGKTYALVGPTGGGKTTTASLMARLYDPTDGQVLLHGTDIRDFSEQDRTSKIGFILQEPFLFSGTVRDNILYANDKYKDASNEEVAALLEAANLGKLLSRFSEGLDTKLASGADAVSLGQKQIIAFIRAVLREPELLILDEATANIDTVTERLLQEILDQLPKETTRVVIAHRLNTIENADEIFFVNAGDVVAAGGMEHAVDMLLHGKRTS
jgi:ATP-binding cassette subfamily B protein